MQSPVVVKSTACRPWICPLALLTELDQLANERLITVRIRSRLLARHVYRLMVERQRATVYAEGHWVAPSLINGGYAGALFAEERQRVRWCPGGRYQ